MACLLTARAQAYNQLDTTFPDPNISNNTVACVIQDHNGRTVAAGDFTAIGGTAPGHVARFKVDGTLDSTFANPDINGPVYAMAEDANGKILVAGLFNTVNGVTRNRVARLNADGTLDPTFGDAQVFSNVSGIIISSLSAIAVDPSGRIVIAGAFNLVTGSARNYLARLNADGTLDPTFADPLLDTIATTVAIDPSGRVLVGGQFTSAGGSTRHLLARFNVDGTLDPTFADPALSGGGNGVEAVTVDGSGRIVVAGDFTSAGGSTRRNLARFNPDGTLDPSLADPNLNNLADAVRVDSHGKIVVAGAFTTAGASNAARNCLARFNRDGTLDPAFANPNLNASASALAVDANGRILVGGSFTFAGGAPRNRLARFNGEPGVDPTRADPTFTPDPALGFANAMAMGPDGKILIAGGNFIAAGSHAVERVNPDGSLDSTFTDPSLDVGARGIAVDGDGKIVIVGDFSTVGGLSRTGVARLNVDGTTDSTFDATDPNYFRTYSVAIDGNGKILVGSQLLGVKRLNSDGSADGTFTSPNLNGQALAITMAGDGRILIAGQFTTAGAGNAARNRLARFNADGTIDSTFADPNLNGDVDAVIVDHTGKIIVGGDFTTAGTGNAMRNRVARFNADGTLDSTFGDPGMDATVLSLREDGNGQILVSGRFANVGGRAQAGLARLNVDGTLDPGFNNPQFDDDVWGVLIDGNGKLVVGGHFTQAGSGSSLVSGNFLARLQAIAPTVTAISPATGPAAGGTSVTITGTNFTGASAVLFGPAAAASFTVNSDTSITAVSPVVAAGSTVDVTVANASGASAAIAADHFLFYGPMDHFGVSAPASVTSLTHHNVTVTAQDAFGDTVPDYAGTVHLTSTDSAFIAPADSTLTNGTRIFDIVLKTAGTQTVTATDTVTSSLTGTSGNITVNPGAAAALAVTVPASATAGSAVSVSVTAFDAFGNVATGYAGTVAFTSSDIAATLPAASTLTSGVGSFSVTFKTAGNRTVTATDTVSSSVTGTSAFVTVNPGAATHLSLSAPSAATAGASSNFTVRALDAFGNLDTGYTGTVHFTSTDGAAILPADSTLTNGVGSLTFTMKTAGNQTVTATDTVTASITGTTANIGVNSAAATHFVVSAPASAMEGIASSVTVTALDAFNNTATGYAGTVAFSSSDAAATLPANTLLLAGTGTVSVTFKTLGGHTVTATDTVSSSITGTSATVNVVPGPATHFTVSAPANATAGAAVSVTVTALDAFNHTATGYAGTVSFTSTDGAAVLPANSTLTAGVGTLSATLKTAGTQTITATDTVTSSITGTSSTVTVGATTVSHFSVSAPGSATAGSAMSVTVTALDAFNNTATGYAGTVAFTSTDGAATLPANSTLTAGTGTFSVTLKTAGSHTVTATDTVTSSITGTSSGVTVNPAAATHLSVSVPASATAGSAVNVTVTALDAFNNTATGYAGTVTFTSTDGAATLPANSTLTAGTKTFSATFRTAGSETISATDTVTSSITGTSSVVTVSGAAATHLGVTVPGSATAGTAISVTVTALDAFNNTATGYAGTVAFTSTDGVATLPANSTLTAGVGTFSATLKTVGSATLTATDTVTASITGTSGNVTVNPAVATRFTFFGLFTAIGTVPTNFTITARDAYGNTVTGYAGTIHFTSSDGLAHLPGDATLTSGFGSFGATFFTGGNQTLTATDTTISSITGTTSFPVIPIEASVTIAGTSQSYDGSPKAVTITTAPSGLVTSVTYDGSSTVPSAAGSYGVVATITNPGYSGSATATLTIAKADQTVTFDAIDALAVGTPVTLSASASSGLPVTFSVLSGNATVSGNMLTVNDGNPVTVRASQAGNVNFNPATADRTVTAPTSRLVNLSSRANVGAGEKLLIIGFVIAGPQPKPVLVRAVGPGLSSLGVVNVLADPRIQIIHNGVAIAANDNWGDNTDPAAIASAAARVGAFPLASGSKDASLLVTLDPGAYTALVTGTGAGAGVAIAEVYDASADPTTDVSRLVNSSSRGDVTSGENILIGGFVITGNTPKQVLIRGVGAALSGLGVGSPLPDPVLEVYQGQTRIARNDNWGDDPTAAAQISSAATATGAFPLAAGSKDAAVVLTLAPGLYTVHVIPAAGTAAGVAMIEIYDVP